ncbi:MAG: glycerol-3-phosphate acyltransferase [Christensenellales bacterium]|jgi:glycerol-3-phosphate acyltransferase PlsY
MSIYLKYALSILIGYFIGNISFARIISARLKTDITKQGSGNPGTMNMLRTFGFKVGLLNLVLDALKGVSAALIGFFIFGGSGAQIQSTIGIYVGGLGAVLGHNFPVVYKFKGGKGVACILGIYIVANPLWSLVGIVLSFVYLYFFDYGAVASFLFITLLTVLEGLKYRGVVEITILLFVLFFLTWFMHRKNIERLLWGKENKVNLAKAFKKKKPKDKTKE